MDVLRSDIFFKMEPTCGSLRSELQAIWDEVGESEDEKDNMLLQIEKECLDAYRRRVDQAYQRKAQLRQAIADSEAELAQIFSAMGERPVHVKQSQNVLSLKEEFNAITLHLDQIRKKKDERKSQFIDVLDQIYSISNEIYESSVDATNYIPCDDGDLSLRKLDELRSDLLAMQKEKSTRQQQVLDHSNTLHSLCIVLAIDFRDKISTIHPTLSDDFRGTRNLTDVTIEKLSTTIQYLKEVKRERLQRLQDLANTMLELWNLLDTPLLEQQIFHNITSKIATSEDKITEHGALSEDLINCVEAEVLRLEHLKTSKMKELILKKRSEFEAICRKTHVTLKAQTMTQYSVEAICSGAIDPARILEQLEVQIAEAKEEAFSRKDVLEKVEKWLAACEEECWLEEYDRDENRYHAGRGTHLMLKRAEKARVIVKKIPAMVETLTLKAREWEKIRGSEFSYDGVHLLSMLEQYSTLRQEKELERQWQKEQRKLQGQLLTEQEALFGSKPSPTKSARKAPRNSMGGTPYRRISLCGHMLQNSKPEEANNLHSHTTAKPARANQNGPLNHHQYGGLKNSVPPGHPPKKLANAANPREHGLQSTRKPFPALSSTSVGNQKRQKEDENRRRSMIPQTVLSAASTVMNHKTSKQDENRRLSMTLEKVRYASKASQSTPSRHTVSENHGRRSPDMSTMVQTHPPNMSAASMFMDQKSLKQGGNRRQSMTPDKVHSASKSTPSKYTIFENHGSGTLKMSTLVQTSPKYSISDLPVATPSKITSADNNENVTPKTLSTPLRTTPPTSTVYKQKATTPASNPGIPDAFEVNEESYEHSFEEIRAGFDRQDRDRNALPRV